MGSNKLIEQPTWKCVGCRQGPLGLMIEVNGRKLGGFPATVKPQEHSAARKHLRYFWIGNLFSSIKFVTPVEINVSILLSIRKKRDQRM